MLWTALQEKEKAQELLDEERVLKRICTRGNELGRIIEATISPERGPEAGERETRA